MSAGKEGEDMDLTFSSYEEFIIDYKNYRMDKCDKCGSVREIIVNEVSITLEGRILHFPELFVLCCKKCGCKCLPEYSKQMIDGAYKNMVKQNQYVGEFVSKNYKKEFEYCKDQNYNYDHKDYYNIPGLCYDDEHSVEGFLTPVYFDRKALIYFLSVPEYDVDIFSETYGHIGKKDVEGVYVYDWNVPFGFNRNGKLVFWLGDLSHTPVPIKTKEHIYRYTNMAKKKISIC